MRLNVVNMMSAACMATTMVSCLPDPLPVRSVPQLETKIVISSQMLPQQGVTIAVTKSIGALDAGEGTDPEALIAQIVVDDALVTLQSDGRIDTLLNLGSGVYASPDVVWRNNARYTLHVNSESLGEVSAITELATTVSFDELQTQLVPSSFDSVLNVSYTLTDPPGKNYYVVSVQKFSNLQDLSSLLNPVIFNHLIEDTGGEEKIMEGEFSAFFPGFSKGDSVAVFLSSVNNEYFNFLKLRNDDQFNLTAFVSEPMRYPSNVQGGYGFFNLHLPDVRIFRVED